MNVTALVVVQQFLKYFLIPGLCLQCMSGDNVSYYVRYCPILGIIIYLTHFEIPWCRYFGKLWKMTKKSQNLDTVKGLYSILNQIFHLRLTNKKNYLSLDTPCSSKYGKIEQLTIGQLKVDFLYL